MDNEIWIWGMGEAGRLVLKFLSFKKVKVKGLIDNSEKLCNRGYDTYKIISFEEAKSVLERDELIICCCSLSLYELFKKSLISIGHHKYIHFYDLDLSEFMYQILDNGNETRIISRLCTENDFYNENFRQIKRELIDTEEIVLRRKVWEWVYIIQVLQYYKMLGEGKKGIGFAVGKEPLPSYFAKNHTDVLASDLGAYEENAKDWVNTNQHSSGNLKELWYGNICPEQLFDKHVKYRDINMNDLPADEKDYDFCWSSCAIEHVGDLEKSKLFLKKMLNVLKSGGVAVHTTEFNLSSDNTTIEYGDSVIYRRKDIEEMKKWFRKNGHYMETSYKRAKTEGNCYVDIGPFESEYKPYHLTLVANGYIETSFAIIVIKDELKNENIRDEL